MASNAPRGFRIIRDEGEVFVAHNGRSEFRIAKNGLSEGKRAKFQSMCRGGEVKPRKMAEGGEVDHAGHGDAAPESSAPPPIAGDVAPREESAPAGFGSTFSAEPTSMPYRRPPTPAFQPPPMFSDAASSMAVIGAPVVPAPMATSIPALPAVIPDRMPSLAAPPLGAGPHPADTGASPEHGGSRPMPTMGGRGGTPPRAAEAFASAPAVDMRSMAPSGAPAALGRAGASGVDGMDGMDAPMPQDAAPVVAHGGGVPPLAAVRSMGRAAAPMAMPANAAPMPSGGRDHWSEVAEHARAGSSATAGGRMSHGGEVKPYKLIEETDAHFLVDDGRGPPFRVAKNGISPAMHERIRGYADGGEIPALTGDPATDALIAGPGAASVAPEIAVAPAHVPADIPTAPPPPAAPFSAVDVRTGRTVTVDQAPPAPVFEPYAAPWPPGAADATAAPAPALAPSHVPELVPAAAHTPGAILPGIINPQTETPVPLAPAGVQLPGVPNVQGEIAAGRAEQARGIEAEAQAAEAEARERARILAEGEQRRERARQDYESRLRDLQGKGDALYQNILDKKVDPRRLWNDASVGRKITASIGMLLGGIGSALTGGPNYAVEIIDREIARDIDAQKTEIAKGENLLAHNMRQTDDLRLAHQLTRADLLDATAARIQQAAASFAGDKAKAAATTAIGTLRAEAAKERQAVAATQQQLAAQAQLLPLQIEQAKRSAAMQRLQMQALGAVLGGVGSSLDSRALALLPDDMRERVVLLPGGKAAMAPTKEDAGKVREAIEAVTELNGAIADMREFRKTHSGGTMLPAAASAATATALALRNKMVRAMGKGLGVLNQSDYELLFGMIPDPAAFFRTDNAVNAALDVLQQSSNDKMGSAIKARLIGYADSPRVRVKGKE